MNPVHILLVDDEEQFVLNLALMLRNRGFKVSTACRGFRALYLLSVHKDIAVVVLDVRMPVLDGIETLERIKVVHPEVEVIMLTGQATLEDGIMALRRGAFDYVQKPCDIQELGAMIQAASHVEHIRQHPVLWPRATAGEMMRSGFIPLLPEDTLDRALAIFSHYPIGKGAQLLFVVDDRQQIQGVLRRDDLCEALAHAAGKPSATWDQVLAHPEIGAHIPASRIMHRKVATVSAATPLAEAARRMLQANYDSIPVVSDTAVQGIIRLRDVLHYLQAAGSEEASG